MIVGAAEGADEGEWVVSVGLDDGCKVGVADGYGVVGAAVGGVVLVVVAVPIADSEGCLWCGCVLQVFGSAQSIHYTSAPG